MRLYKSASTAARVANGRPYLAVTCNGVTKYLVPGAGEEFDSLDEIALLSAPNDGGGREFAGFIGLGHLDRLGNGNHAAAAKGEHSRATAFPIERRRGLAPTFQDYAEGIAYEADKDLFLAGARGAFFGDEANREAFTAKHGLEPGENVTIEAAKKSIRAVRDRRHNKPGEA